MLGRAVPDERSVIERLTRPRPAVWSRRGRLAYAVVLVGMLAALRWGGHGALGIALVVLLFVVALLVVAADERRRARRFYRSNDGR